jgi:hypothetical protein
LFLVFTGPLIYGQVTTVDIVGTVTDTTGAVIPGVVVKVENVATDLTRIATSDSQGNYAVALLPPGHYTVEVQQAGFRPWRARDVLLAVGDKLRLDVHLEVGQLTESVEVVDHAPALQSESTSLGELVNTQAVADLPLNGRDYIYLARTAIGANQSVQTAISSGNRPDDRRDSNTVSVNGQSDIFNNFMIDGVDDNERELGTVIIKSTIADIQEFKVESMNYSAAYGRTAGAVVNIITKSGTNKWHGSAFEFIRNDKLDAANFFEDYNGAPKGELRRNNFGGSIGGPIRKDRTFIFGDFEQRDLRQGITYTSTVPTEAERGGNFAGVATIFNPLTTVQNPDGTYTRTAFTGNLIPSTMINSIASEYLTLFPTPQTSALVNNFTYSPAEAQRSSRFDVRVDHKLTERDNIFVRYSFDNTGTFLPPNLPDETLPNIGKVSAGGDLYSFTGPSTQQMEQLQLNEVHTFSPHLMGELKFAASRLNSFAAPDNYGKNVSAALGIPNVNVSSDTTGLTPITLAGYRGLGDSEWLPLRLIDNSFQTRGSITHVSGRHTTAIGIAYVRRQVAPHQSPVGLGQFSFDQNFTNDPSGATPNSGDSVASFLLGYPAETARQVALVHIQARASEGAAYVQDDWRVTNRLTVNLGLRYDVFTAFTEKHDQFSNIDFATGQMAIAGQNGISNSAGVGFSKKDFQPRLGLARRVTDKFVMRAGFGMSFYPGSYNVVNQQINPPFTNNYDVSATPLYVLNSISAGVPLPVPTSATNPSGSINSVDFHLRDPYVYQMNGTMEYELRPGLVWSTSYVGTYGREQLAAWDVNMAPAGPGDIGPRRRLYNEFPNLDGVYLTTNGGNSSYNALGTKLEQRLSHGLNLLVNYTYGHALSNVPGAFGYGGKNSSSSYPQDPDNVALDKGNSDFDIRHRANILLNYELPFGKNFSGGRGVLIKGWQVNSLVTLSSGQTFTVNNSSPQDNTGESDRPNQVGDPHLPSNQRTINQWFNTSAFALQPLFTYGTTGVNTLYGPGLSNWDFSLFKDFPLPHLGEKAHLSFRAEFFNILNHPNFDVPDGNLGDGTFGVISSTANNQPRQIQFALMLSF